MSLLKELSTAVRQRAPGEIRITLGNSAQGWHLHQALLGHCEVDMLPGSEGTALVVSNASAGSRPILRRVDAWLTEFGVDTISLELAGRTYEMKKV